jgi:hypothetical protein
MFFLLKVMLKDAIAMLGLTITHNAHTQRDASFFALLRSIGSNHLGDNVGDGDDGNGTHRGVIVDNKDTMNTSGLDFGGDVRQRAVLVDDNGGNVNVDRLLAQLGENCLTLSWSLARFGLVIKFFKSRAEMLPTSAPRALTIATPVMRFFSSNW